MRAELNEHDIYLMTISDVRGCGKERGQSEVYRGSEFEEQLINKLKLEIAVNDNFLEDALEAILVGGRSSSTGAIVMARSSSSPWKMVPASAPENGEHRHWTLTPLQMKN